jgi:hypothetical protein
MQILRQLRKDFNHNLPFSVLTINPLTPELNPSAQRYLTRYFTGDFAS